MGARIASAWRMPDELWARIRPLLPREKPAGTRGRPVVPFRQVMDGIFYVLRTGCHWKAVPREFGSGSTVHRRFQEWTQAGIFERLWRDVLQEYDALVGIDWTWQSLDSAITKAPLGGEETGPNPTDRAKSGTKRHLLTDGRGTPLAVTVSGANRHDKKKVEDTLKVLPENRPTPTPEEPQHFCADKGYDFPDVRDLVTQWGYTLHIKARGEEQAEKARIPGYRARRWVVERTHSWMNRFRKLLIRFEKKVQNFLGLIHLACAFITARRAGILG